jgi:hypothetical protein
VTVYSDEGILSSTTTLSLLLVLASGGRNFRRYYFPRFISAVRQIPGMTKDPHDRTPHDHRSEAPNPGSQEDQDALDDRSARIQEWEDEE